MGWNLHSKTPASLVGKKEEEKEELVRIGYYKFIEKTKQKTKTNKKKKVGIFFILFFFCLMKIGDK